MGAQYLIDSNAVIEFLGGMLPTSASNHLQKIVEQKAHCISVINQIELLGFNGPTSDMQMMQAFIESSLILPLDDAVVETTIDLRKSFNIKLPDAIIAATAQVHQLKIITRNIADFRKLQQVDVINSYDL